MSIFVNSEKYYQKKYKKKKDSNWPLVLIESDEIYSRQSRLIKL